MVAKLGAILLTCVFSQNEVFSGDDVDATSLLSLRGVVQTRQSCPVTPSGAKQVYNQIAEMVGDCREVIMGKTTDNNHITGATCPSGYMAITSHDECHKACDALDQVHKWRPSTTNNNQPDGCFTAARDPAGNCHFNINNEGNDDKGFKPFYLANSQSMCMKQTESLKKITVITETMSSLWAGSKANFYIDFPGDVQSYQLDTPKRDRKKGATDTFVLTVLASADVTGPTIRINKGHGWASKQKIGRATWNLEVSDGWRIKSLKIIDETGAEVKLTNVLQGPRQAKLKNWWLDGNCKPWQGICSQALTLKP